MGSIVNKAAKRKTFEIGNMMSSQIVITNHTSEPTGAQINSKNMDKMNDYLPLHSPG